MVRTMTNRSLPPLVALLVTAVLAALLVGGTTTSAQAAKKPQNDYPRMPSQCATAKEKIPAEPTVCPLNTFDKARPTLVIWGDSHSWMFIPAVKKAVQGRRVNLVAVMMGSCPPMDNRVKPDDAVPACFRSNALGIQLTRQLEANGRPYRILLAGSWQRYLHALKVRDRTSYVGVMAKAMRQGTPRLVRTLSSIGADVDVVAQVATVPAKRKKCKQGNTPYACTLPRKKSLPEAATTRKWLADVMRPALGSRAPIDVNRTFCNASTCRGKVGGIRTWFDDLHISATRSATLASYFTATVDAISPVEEPEEPEEPCTILGIPVPCL
jgi:hypothetical protein